MTTTTPSTLAGPPATRSATSTLLEDREMRRTTLISYGFRLPGDQGGERPSASSVSDSSCEHSGLRLATTSLIIAVTSAMPGDPDGQQHCFAWHG